MIKYLILVWYEDDLSDIRVLVNPADNKPRIFDDYQTAETHAKIRTVNCDYAIVETQIVHRYQIPPKSLNTYKSD